MIPINLLPHRAERRKAQQRQFAVLAGATAAIGIGIVVLVHGFLAQRIDTQNQRNRYLEEQITLLDKQIDVVMFTSASTVRSLARHLGEDQAADLLRPTVVACIGPVTAEAAEQLGIHSTVIPKEYTIAALVGAIVQHFQDADDRVEVRR